MALLCSLLLSLPPELRDRIYIFALAHNTDCWNHATREPQPDCAAVIKPVSPDDRDPAWLADDYYQGISHGHLCTYACLEQPPLLRVCRQIRLEAAPVFYRINTFIVSVEALEDWRKDSESWRAQRRRARHRLRRWFSSIRPFAIDFKSLTISGLGADIHLSRVARSVWVLVHTRRVWEGDRVVHSKHTRRLHRAEDVFVVADAKVGQLESVLDRELTDGE